ncbi:armadillo repeat-containing protein 2 isoform X2 [Pungitius pungitius]|uniref:armadillo repeat-containing protein 2 isoform X2 n=1 Tax=Pungitius pungitius TaxID=134920 RepID=UPI002E0D58D8
MASMNGKGEVCSPFIPRRNPVRRTSAEIVSEARRSLRVQSTQRPFTPRDGHRQLFGASSVRDSRPPSAFSLHAQNFDAPDSRPGSGTRLSPLDHKPKFPVLCDAEDPFRSFPKTPSAPLEVKKGPPGMRARLLRTGSLTALSPVEGHKDSENKYGCKEQSNPSAGQKQLSAKRPPGTDKTEGPRKPGPRRTSSERIKQPGVASGVGLPECTAEQRTEQGNRDKALSTEEDAESSVWNNMIAPRLQQLESVAAAVPGGPEGSVDRLCDLCDGLHGTLAEADMLGRRCKRRSGILRTLFRLIDLNSAPLNLHIAELCLALCVSGNNLLNICKLIFQISRRESNDILFQNSSIIDSFLGILNNEDVSTSGEALLYCVGTLKFLSGNGAILRLLLEKNCVGVAQKLIQRLRTAADITIAGHILVQLTATLRNLADHPDSRPLFISFSILPELCVVLSDHRKDPDICTNISRIYSKLSSYSECRLALAQTPNCYQLFLDLLNKHHQKQDLVVRLLFTLGNLTAKSDEARWRLFGCEGCVGSLLQLYDAYQRRDDSPHTPSLGEPRAPPGKVQQDEDVLVKLVRVLANMCIHPAVGPALASNTTCIQLLMETLELRCVRESEELLVNVAATINNLSFYQEDSSVLRHSQLSMAKLMLKLVLGSSMDAMLEATRVYGNLSQSKNVRDFIMQNKVHQFVVTLLDSKSTEMCISACGVLTNLAQDPPNRVSLSVEGAIAKLVDCLRDFGPGDWQLVGQVCQALWNMISCGPEKLLDSQERESLLEILTTYLDEEEALKWIEDDDMRDSHRACWELEFLPVAQKLMKTLQPPDQTA